MQVSPTKKIPIDAALFTRLYHRFPKMNYEQTTAYINNLCNTVCREQQSIEILKIKEENFNEPASLAVSTYYLEGVKKGNLEPRRYKKIRFTENSVIFEDGTEERIDAIVMCTGYKNSVSFLDHSIKEGIEYDEGEQKQPYILYQGIAHPDFPNLLFLGMYKAVQIPACDLHAQLAIKLFSGKIKLPSR